PRASSLVALIGSLSPNAPPFKATPLVDSDKFSRAAFFNRYSSVTLDVALSSPTSPDSELPLGELLQQARNAGFGSVEIKFRADHNNSDNTMQRYINEKILSRQGDERVREIRIRGAE